MPLQVIYFAFPGRVEPTRLALACGGIEFEDKQLSREEWAEGLRKNLTPKQMPLLCIDGEYIGQSAAIMRYAAKIAKVDGKPLYPENPLEALKIDEFCDIISETFGPLAKTFAITDDKERQAARGALFADDGELTKWLTFIDSLLGKSSSGFAVNETFSLADLCTLTWVQPLKTGWLDGISTDCLDKYTHICKHAVKITNIPQVKAYYKDASGLHSVFKAQ
eukprot:TRINITY_DN26844_c0_g1_i1.p2 TRINITY_DN26844_c0_g1~~TRINITY_DN26844_c0_g1_i1.p2  ORF type:complete len:221 (+),score=59.74 TRINITY_DN26844_c0_g1_i1:85-747(+)